MDLEHVDGAERNSQVALEFRDELVAENGDDKAEQKVEEESERAGDAVGLVHVVGRLDAALVDEALGTDFRDIVDGAHSAEQEQDDQRRYGIAVHVAHEQRDNLDHDHQEQPAHDRGGFCLAVLVEVARRVDSLQQADVLGHEEEDEDDGKHRGGTGAEKSSVEKFKTGYVIEPTAKHGIRWRAKVFLGV